MQGDDKIGNESTGTGRTERRERPEWEEKRKRHSNALLTRLPLRRLSTDMAPGLSVRKMRQRWAGRYLASKNEKRSKVGMLASGCLRTLSTTLQNRLV